MKERDIKTFTVQLETYYSSTMILQVTSYRLIHKKL